ncbi:reverse transcriptase domain, Reverse transcriptase zinc-binding domain protein [Artemisia annua]|uniref:Reverse transcriptase domain, Reverse transcriptase zinc-binding domain protein n=1 Tax=Artemisia annua TaxID=35608 RepID=A0A2U1M6S7_ARTAN|nr:reverse transcriptase domain, Reverse transcriptase zinc-binding domain protein [Artemisia annua]
MFTFHHKCSHLNIINLCFADDLFLFAHGDAQSAGFIMESLEEFKESVLSSMHIYWASVFVLPARIVSDLEQLMRGFLWKGYSKVAWEVVCLPKEEGGLGIRRLESFNTALIAAHIWRYSKVAWEVVCLPKEEGGLGIRRLEFFNTALIAAHIWRLFNSMDSLWVKWIHTYRLRGRNFWDVPSRAWFDKWCSVGPLSLIVSSRDIYRAGFTSNSLLVRNRPWCVLGDFNSALNLEDKVEGSLIIDIAMREFKECVDANELPRGLDGTLRKIDRIMANLGFLYSFAGAHANSRFKQQVQESWCTSVSGFHMFKVVSKLKALKKPFRSILFREGNIHEKVTKLRHELDAVQRALDLDPFNVDLREEEACYLNAKAVRVMNNPNFDFYHDGNVVDDGNDVGNSGVTNLPQASRVNEASLSGNSEYVKPVSHSSFDDAVKSVGTSSSSMTHSYPSFEPHWEWNIGDVHTSSTSASDVDGNSNFVPSKAVRGVRNPNYGSEYDGHMVNEDDGSNLLEGDGVHVSQRAGKMSLYPTNDTNTQVPSPNSQSQSHGTDVDVGGS